MGVSPLPEWPLSLRVCPEGVRLELGHLADDSLRDAPTARFDDEPGPEMQPFGRLHQAHFPFGRRDREQVGRTDEEIEHFRSGSCKRRFRLEDRHDADWLPCCVGLSFSTGRLVIYNAGFSANIAADR